MFSPHLRPLPFHLVLGPSTNKKTFTKINDNTVSTFIMVAAYLSSFCSAKPCKTTLNNNLRGRDHLPMGRLRIREVNSSASGCTAGHFRWGINPGLSLPHHAAYFACSSSTTRKLVATCGPVRESRKLSSGAPKAQWSGTQRSQRIPEPVVCAKEEEKTMIQTRWFFYRCLPPRPSLSCRELSCHMVPNQWAPIPLSKDVLTLPSP